MMKILPQGRCAQRVFSATTTAPAVTLLVLVLCLPNCNSWMTQPLLVPKLRNNHERSCTSSLCRRSRSQPHSLVVCAAAAPLPDDYQEYGEQRIRSAASLCGASQDQITVEWKGTERIVVTVSGNVYVSDPPLSTTALDNDDYDDDDYQEEEEEDSIPEGAVDLTTLARAINTALDDEGVGLAIAETHEIEVTTPGASDVLTGDVMFDAYRGFPVLVEHRDPKKKDTVKTVEGKLVERNDEFTIINIKGRMKKMRNENVLSVKLPKAKKEKGVR